VAGTLIGHGFYPRKALDPRRTYPLLIRRWLCTTCHRTVAMLPSFLLRFRHYLLAVIQAVVVGRYEQQQSWSTVEEQTTAQGALSSRTIRRWCTSFVQAPAVGAGRGMAGREDSARPA
jgi:hypothetical protein